MSKKSFLSYCFAILLLVICVFIKQHSITKKNQKSAISFYSSWKNEGKPVLVQRAQKNDLENSWKLTIVLESGNTYIGYVPKALLRSLSITSPVFIHFREKKVPAAITEVSSILHPDTGMYPVKILASEKLGEKNEKYLAEVTTSGMKNVLLLPDGAIHTENNQSFVWIAKEGKAHKQCVTLGERNSKGILTRGIEEKELVILDASASIQENDLLKITYGN